jgi:hypothetical protein
VRARRRDRVVGADEGEQDLLALTNHNPHISSRAAAAEVGLSQSTVLRIWRRHKYHPYRIHLHQAMRECDHDRRIEFCVFMQELIADNPGFLAHVLWSDESTFHRDGTVNRHNMHYWSQENPHWLRQDRHQVRWKVNVWAGIVGDTVIGPYFLDGALTGQRYLQFLTDDLLDAVPLAMRRGEGLWFQQDGAPPHYLRAVRDWLDARFPGRWIGRGGPLAWPPRSPDLTPLDFFLWGYIKGRVYQTAPANAEELKERIRDAMAAITPRMLRDVRRNLTQRFADCLTADGRHFEHTY